MEKTEKRIETKTSRTAEFICMIRAASFYEKIPQYKNERDLENDANKFNL